MRGNSGAALFHPDHLIHLRKEIKTVGEQEDDGIACGLPEAAVYLFLGRPVERGERIVQHKDRMRVGEGPGQRETLLLSTGEPDAAAADPGICAVRHGADLPVQTDGTQYGIQQSIVRGRICAFSRVARRSHQDILANGVTHKLWIVAEITDDGLTDSIRQSRQLLPGKTNAAFVGLFTQEGFAEGGFATGHRAGDADDGSGCRGKGDAGKNRVIRILRIGKTEIFHSEKCRRRGGLCGLLRRPFHQWNDAAPGHLCLLHGIEEFGCVRRLHRQFGVAGKKGRERRDIPCRPSGSGHIAGAEPEDEEHGTHGDDIVKRRHGTRPDVGEHSPFLIIGEVCLIVSVALWLTAEDAVCQRAGHTVHGGGREPAGALAELRIGAGDETLHPVGDEIGDRGKNQAEEAETPVDGEKQGDVADEGDAGVENFSRELAHALGAGVRVKDCLCHHRTDILRLERGF